MSDGPLPYRIRYGRLDFVSTVGWRWHLAYPLMVALEALTKVWPHQHYWYHYETADPEVCIYCDRPRPARQPPDVRS